MRQFRFQQQKAALRQPAMSSRSANRVAAQQLTIAIYLGVSFIFGVILILFFSGRLVVGGVPSSIIIRFLQDDIARTAYIGGEKKVLHDRLDDLGIEQQIKEYYRPQIPDEAELDQHIHQILYDRTGYVGEAYQVNNSGILVRKN